MLDNQIMQHIQNKSHHFDLHNSTQDLITIAKAIKQEFATFDDDPLILANRILIDVPHQFSSTLQNLVTPLIQISTENEGKSQKVSIIFGKYYDEDSVGFGPTTTLDIKPMLGRTFAISLVTSGADGHRLNISVPFNQVASKTIELLNIEYQNVMGMPLFA